MVTSTLHKQTSSFHFEVFIIFFKCLFINISTDLYFFLHQTLKITNSLEFANRSGLKLKNSAINNVCNIRVVSQLPQRLESMYFNFFLLHSADPLELISWRKKLILAFEAQTVQLLKIILCFHIFAHCVPIC